MKRLLLAAVALATLFSSHVCAQGVFDPTIDPEAQFSAARQAALASHRNILLDLGGNWCAWCLVLDRDLRANPALSRALQLGFVLVHVNVNPVNLNSGFLSRFPRADGYPFLIVVDPRGPRILHAQNGLAFQRGAQTQSGYDDARILAFLFTWSARR